MQRRTGLSATMCLAALACAMIVAALVQVPSPAFAASGPTGLVVAPVAGTPGADRGYFRFKGVRGADSAQVLEVTNPTAKPKTIRLAACDGLSAVFGGVAYSNDGEPTVGVGSWIVLSANEVIVPAGATVRIPFKVRVPANATNGAHIGGVSVWEPAAVTKSTSTPSGSVQTNVHIVSRMVTTVWVTIPGPTEPAIAISGLSVSPRSDGMCLVVAFASVGTTPTSGTGTLIVEGGGFQREFSFGTMLPDSKTEYPVNWMIDPPAGTYRADVVIRYAGGAKVARWSGPFTVTAAAKVVEIDRVPGLREKTRTNWLLIGLSAALALALLWLLVGWLVRRHNKKRDGAPRHERS